MTTPTTGPAGPPEITGLASAQAYATGMTQAYAAASTKAETFAAGLDGYGVSGPAVAAVGRAHELTTAAAAAWQEVSGALEQQTTVKEAYAVAPEAGDKEFVTDGAGNSGVAAPASTTAGDSPPAGDSPRGGADTTRPGGTTAGAFRCNTCGYVMKTPPLQDGMVAVEPAGCRNCRTRGTTFSPTETFYPNRPSDEALERDTRDVEAAIRAAYARLADRPGFGVPLADLREALPAEFDRDTVDAALTKLGAHSDVNVTPHSDHHQTDDRTQHAALARGGAYDHTLRIYPDHSMLNTLQTVRSTSRVQADSILSSLSDREVAWLADKMDVDTDTSPTELRERVAERADRNHHEWLADAEQGRLDGTLLYRADNEPDWAAAWTPQQRQAAREAAQRLLVRADTQENWAYVRERATRWL